MRQRVLAMPRNSFMFVLARESFSQMPLDAARQKVVDRLVSNNCALDEPEIAADLELITGEIKQALEALDKNHALAGEQNTLRRFAIACKLKVPDTLAMIEAHMRWRAANLPVKITPAIVAELRKGKVESYGTDVNGNPLILVRSGKFDPKERDLAVANAAVIYLLEKSIAESPTGVKFVVFYDRADFSLRKNLDLDFVKALASVLLV